jgi:hypothetical protein
VFYRKDEIYSMGWKVPDLSDYLYTVARNGGPIGMSPFFSARLGSYSAKVEDRGKKTLISSINEG